MSDGQGSFSLQPLPVEAQFAPIYAALASDYTGDGIADLLVGGNFSGVTPVLGKYDASYGLLLRGDGAGHFTAVDMEQSGVAIAGEVRRMRALRAANGDRLIVVARNDTPVEVLRPRAQAGAVRAVALDSSALPVPSVPSGSSRAFAPRRRSATVR